MATHHGVDGCKFCEIVKSKKELHLKEGEKCVVIKDIKPKAPHHYLVVSRAHINKPTDLTAADLDLVRAMERTGRDYLRQALKETGEADTVEDMLRIGFHMPPLISINHLHMHFLYPIKDLSLMSRMLTFRPGKVFKEVGAVIEEMEKTVGVKDPLAGNPAAHDVVDAHANAVSN